jgi:hypothetical protein
LNNHNAERTQQVVVDAMVVVVVVVVLGVAATRTAKDQRPSSTARNGVSPVGRHI